MKTTSLILVLVVLPFYIFAQSNYKPLKDTTLICDKEQQPFNLVTEMPNPKIGYDKIVDILQTKVLINEDEKIVTGIIYVQFIVNCKGESGDYQISKSADKLKIISEKIIEIFKKENFEWNPGKQRGYSVDVLMLIKLAIKEGKFSVI